MLPSFLAISGTTYVEDTRHLEVHGRLQLGHKDVLRPSSTIETFAIDTSLCGPQVVCQVLPSTKRVLDDGDTTFSPKRAIKGEEHLR